MWGLLEKRLGDLGRAAKLLEASVELEPSSVSSLLHLGLIERRASRPEASVYGCICFHGAFCFWADLCLLTA